jgi:hypothetical protein
MTQVECNRRAVSGRRRKTKAPSAGGMRSHSTPLRPFTSSTRLRVFDAPSGTSTGKRATTPDPVVGHEWIFTVETRMHRVHAGAELCADLNKQCST